MIRKNRTDEEGKPVTASKVHALENQCHSLSADVSAGRGLYVYGS